MADWRWEPVTDDLLDGLLPAALKAVRQLAEELKGPAGPSTRVAVLACLPSGVISAAAGQVVQWSKITGQPCGTWRTAQGTAG